MKALKITPTLINSFNSIFKDYTYGNDPAESSAKSEIDFLKLLRKEPQEYNESFEYGKRYEQKCYNYDIGEDNKEIVEIIKNGTFQVKRIKNLIVNGIRFQLVGIADVVKGAYIYDIKTTKNSYNAPHYLDNSQTSAYFALFPKAEQFGYLIHDYSTKQPKFYTEFYSRSQVEPIENIIAQFVNGMKQLGYWDTYVENWEIYL